ncbi:MAG: SagB/ThcOx family dehydrogenase [Cytophagales bacterium]|nr:SagB/ThcOx family dehydrogenase [Cytophagales bacterium]
MLDTLWNQVKINIESDTPCWEIFHESSKTGHYDGTLTNSQVVEVMSNLYDVFPYKQFPAIPLPETFAPIECSFMEAVANRVTPKEIAPVKLSLEQLRTILFCGYGVTRENKDSEYIHRPFRTVPSGGALYPLELYFYSNEKVEGLKAGLYHYSPVENSVQLIREGNFDNEIAETLVGFQTNLAYDTSLLIFITAVFNRSTFKYKEKGYRFALFEAGHAAQNINLAATALELGVINIGGYHDRLVDRFLKIDGLNHSTIYMNGICKGN